MAGERIKLTVTEREAHGSRESRRLRRDGFIPGVLYGRSKPRSICVPERELRRALSGPAGLHAILDVVLEGQKTTHPSVLKDYQQDKLRGHVIHIDLHEVRLDQPIQTSVSVHLVGGEDAPGVREGGVLSQVTREVTVEALPMEVPEHLDLDVGAMAIGDTLRISDLRPPEAVTMVDDPETVLATVTLPTRVVEPEEPVEEAEEGAEAAEGEEAPEGAAEASAEPEAPAAGGEGTTEG
ncbi:MAG TPA: 50S ribosomal protein L25 [Gaiellaceae bacterium]|jgi:large subunit ribosomal protein L25